MRRILEELFLRVEGRLQPVEHAIDGSGHRTDLVAVLESGPQSHGIRRDLVCQRRNRLQRSQSTASRKPCAHRRQDHADGAGQQCGVEQALHRFQHRLKRGRCQRVFTAVDGNHADSELPRWELQGGHMLSLREQPRLARSSCERAGISVRGDHTVVVVQGKQVSRGDRFAGVHESLSPIPARPRARLAPLDRRACPRQPGVSCRPG